ncbi:phage integrase Arm DNA-binding domain-containing protein, partial [Klebsiella pneumoniae]|uniref:phage integrase Arm DNA-binding domain-containing protein n=2 Tax=Klebsiella pneumoniae TaxID=573 RepID=UPI001E60EF30
MAARPRKNNISIPNLYPLYSRKVNKVYWRYKHPITGKFHSLGTDEAEATAIAIEANKRLAEQQTRQIMAITDRISTNSGKSISTKESANKQVISSQADSLIKISRIWADFFPANTSNQPI